MSNKYVTISPERMDLGTIDGTKPRNFWFDITNKTGETLDFTAWASCGCTTPVILPSRVLAGETAKLKVQFDPVGKSGLQEKGVGVSFFVDGQEKRSGATFVAKI